MPRTFMLYKCVFDKATDLICVFQRRAEAEAHRDRLGPYCAPGVTLKIFEQDFIKPKDITKQ